VKRLFAWLAGAAGGLAAYRAVKTRPRAHEPAVDDRAAELKARLEAARAAEGDRADPDAGQPAEPGVDEALDPQARRAQVHEQGRAALDEMRSEN
jgi:alkylation response protein AidB-like acyl-CoA dehydrogenase